MKSTNVAGAARFVESAVLAPGMEALLLLMVCLSPWALGAESAGAELWLYIGLAALLVLWAARIVVGWRFSWRNCPVALCLALVFMAGIMQLAPLPKTVLAWVSPATARMYGRLLPVPAEVLPSGQEDDLAAGLMPKHLTGQLGATISLYPEGTRKALVRILAVFLLFVVIRNQIASPAAFRRLSIAALLNGALLSQFALVQFFSSTGPGTIYWSIPSPGQVFGPFVNRNHFAFYMNICLGLALGLLLLRGRRMDEGFDDEQDLGARGTLMAIRRLIRDPVSLWISGGMALMLSGIVFSLSRGGFVALLGAAAIALVLRLPRRHGAWRTGSVLLSVAAALALLIWFGLDRVEDRLSTLWTGEALNDGRSYVLAHAGPLVAQFPCWGSGYGTFQYVEHLYLHRGADFGKAYIHAHNDYLEDLIEGGVFRLGLRLAAIGLILRFGYRAFCDRSQPGAGALALGALFALITIVFHSFVEFGLYLPAIAVLATAVCANLCTLGEQESPSPHEKSDDLAPQPTARLEGGGHRPVIFSSGGIVPLVAATTAVLLGWFLCAEGVRAASIERHLAAARLAAGSVEERTRAIEQLRAAVDLDPNDAELQSALAEAHFEMYKRELTNSSGPRGPVDDEHLEAALRHVVWARDLCPLLPRPNARLAVYGHHLPRSDAASVYMERAKFLAPMNPELWYLCGFQELADGQTSRACENWRRSLDLSDVFLTPILDAASARLDAPALISRVLPERPRLLLLAADYLYPDAADAADRVPFLRKAVDLLDKSSGSLTAEDWRIKALVDEGLAQHDEAIAAYRLALAEDPLRIEWRYELATLLYERGLLREARQEVRTILDQEPRHAGGRRLAEVLARQAAAEG